MTTPASRSCATCRQPFKPIGRARYCSQACRCGTDAGYQSGCNCAGCRAAHTRSVKIRLAIRGRQCVPSLGARRRVDALACLGWSRQELSRRLGHHKSYLGLLLASSTIEPRNAAAVAELYDELSMTRCTSTVAGRVAAAARSRGCVPPLAWDEGTLDDPDARPYGDVAPGSRSRDDIDEGVVVDILAGDFHLPSTKAERTEVCRRWFKSGRSLASLGRATGWRIERYYRVSDQATAA